MSDLHRLLGVPRGRPAIPPPAFLAELPDLIDLLLLEGHTSIRLTMGREHAELLARALRDHVLHPNRASDDRRPTSGGHAGSGRARGSGRRPKP